MSVVKAHNAVRHIGGAVSLDFADFRNEAARILAAAQAESERMLRDARADAARIRAEAVAQGREEGLATSREEGLAEGRAEGEAAGRTQAVAEHSAMLSELAAQWTASLGQWDISRVELMRDARRGLLRLALGIASRVVHRAVQADPELAVTQLEGALGLLGKATSVQVVCSNADLALLTEHMPALLERLGATPDVTFSADPAMAQGGVIVRVAEGAIDATIETQLDRIAETLLPGTTGAGVAS